MSLDNPSVCNFVITYRIRQQDEKYASCIRVHTFDVGEGDWDNGRTASILISVFSFFTLLSYNKYVKHSTNNIVKYHFTIGDILHFPIKVA